MMKTQILIALGAVAALASTAHAQVEPNNGNGIQLRKIPKVEESFPNLSGNRPEGTRLEILNSNIVIFIVRQDSGQALRQIAKVLGVKIVIDPEIKFLPPKTRSLTFNKLDEDIFGDVSRAIIGAENIEMVKSLSGTYFFAAKSVPIQGPRLYYQTPDGTYKRADPLLPPRDFRIIPRPFDGAPLPSDPNEKSPRIDPDFTWPKNFGTIQPLPNWEKREFNGNPYYHMPLPVPVPNSSDGIYILPLPQSGNQSK